MELELFSLLKKINFCKITKEHYFHEGTKLSEDTIEDEKAYPLRRGTIL